MEGTGSNRMDIRRNPAASLMTVLFSAMLFFALMTISSYAYGDWGSLQRQINNAEDGATITLEEDYQADDLPEYPWNPVGKGNEIVIGSEKEITIDLNGHTIDRHLYGESVDINDDVEGVFHVEGMLTIKDSAGGGCIKGGMPDLIYMDDSYNVKLNAFGGAFTVDGGTLNIEGGTITNCHAAAGAVWLKNKATLNLTDGTITGIQGYNGTVVVSEGSTFNMYGGSIEKNTIGGAKVRDLDSGNAAVYVENGTFNMSGGTITDNDGQLTSTSASAEPSSAVRMGENGSFSIAEVQEGESAEGPIIDNNGHFENENLQQERNVYLSSGKKITISCAPNNDARIGVTVADVPGEEETRVITDGLSDRGNYTTFISDSIDYLVVDQNGEAALKKSIPVDSITLVPNELSLERGGKTTLQATISPENASYPDVTWMSDNEGVATVDAGGKVNAVAVGSAKIYAYSSNKLSAECQVTITECNHNWKDATCTDPKTCNKCGDTEGEALGHKLTYNEEKNATCTEYGNIGYYVCDSCGKYFSDEAGITEITDRESVHTDAALGHDYQKVEETANAATCTEAGKEADQECSRCDSHIGGLEIPALGHDWEEWNENEAGLKTRKCRRCDEVQTETVSIENAKVVLSASAFTYNGKVRKPDIKTIGGKALKAGTDYTAKWSNTSSKNVGSYTVTITGEGSYIGVTKATYEIDPKGTSLKKPKKAKKAITVKWKKQSAKMAKSRITGYQIQLATDSKFTENKKTVTVKGYKKVSKKVTKLKGGKKYYVRIRTYKTVSGKKYCSKWSKVKTVKTGK